MAVVVQEHQVGLMVRAALGLRQDAMALPSGSMAIGSVQLLAMSALSSSRETKPA